MRIHEWMHDYDKLNHGRMLKGNFRRALDMCRFGLLESELAILEDQYVTVAIVLTLLSSCLHLRFTHVLMLLFCSYRSGGDSQYVDWIRFSDEIESIFTTKNLEKAPLMDAKQFKSDEEWTTNKLDENADSLFSACVERIATKVSNHIPCMSSPLWWLLLQRLLRVCLGAQMSSAVVPALRGFRPRSQRHGDDGAVQARSH